LPVGLYRHISFVAISVTERDPSKCIIFNIETVVTISFGALSILQKDKKAFPKEAMGNKKNRNIIF
jgi:hypothetical protein